MNFRLVNNQVVAKTNADFTPLGIATSKGVDGRYFATYLSDEIEGRYTQGRYYIVSEVRQRGCGRYTQIGRYTHSRKTQCRLYNLNIPLQILFTQQVTPGFTNYHWGFH